MKSYLLVSLKILKERKSQIMGKKKIINEKPLISIIDYLRDHHDLNVPTFFINDQIISLAEEWVGNHHFEFSPAKNGKHNCREISAESEDEEVLVETLEEVSKYIEQILKSGHLRYFEDNLRDCYIKLSGNSWAIEEAIDAIRLEAESILNDKARNDWKEYQKELPKKDSPIN